MGRRGEDSDMAQQTQGRTVLMVGTRKGLWVGESDARREEWSFTGPHHDMQEVYSCLVDTRVRDAQGRPRLLAGASGGSRSALARCATESMITKRTL